ncbi:MAG: FAD-dependent oxidoreductase [Burkholderiales bacterium]
MTAPHVDPARASSLPRTAFDVAVLGAGPAGAAAAVQAAALRLRVVVIDAQPVAGGQVYRIVPGITPTRPDQERTDGDRVRAELGAASVVRFFGHRLFDAARLPDGFVLHAAHAGGTRTLHAAALIVANGAQERLLPFAGWDTPGVIGLAAATHLLKAQRVLPGRNVVVAGAGPLLLVVAKAIVDGGGRVAAVVDAHPRSAWFMSAADLLSRPDLATRGMGWYRALLARGVPMHNGMRVRSVTGNAPDLRVTAVRVERDGTPSAGTDTLDLACDAVCCGYGLMARTEVTRLLGASHGFDPAVGGWHAVVDDDQRTSVPRLYAAGDGAGIAGAAAAPWQGRVAAFAAALDFGRLAPAAHTAQATPAKREAMRAARFGAVMTRLANIGDGVLADLAPGVPVCACRGITRGAIDAAIAAGAHTVEALQASLGLGQGDCGGRVCEEAAARLVALRTRRPRVEIGQVAPRSPLFPGAPGAA